MKPFERIALFFLAGIIFALFTLYSFNGWLAFATVICFIVTVVLFVNECSDDDIDPED